MTRKHIFILTAVAVSLTLIAAAIGILAFPSGDANEQQTHSNSTRATDARRGGADGPTVNEFIQLPKSEQKAMYLALVNDYLKNESLLRDRWENGLSAIYETQVATYANPSRSVELEAESFGSKLALIASSKPEVGRSSLREVIYEVLRAADAQAMMGMSR